MNNTTIKNKIEKIKMLGYALLTQPTILSKINENDSIKYYNKLNQIDKKRYDYFVKEIRPKYNKLNVENQSFEVGNYIARSYDYGQRRTTITYKRTSKSNLSSNSISRYFGWDRLRRGRRRARSNTEEELSDFSSNIPDDIDEILRRKVIRFSLKKRELVFFRNVYKF